VGAIAGAVMSFVELVEAEARTLREKAAVTAEGMLIMFIGAFLILSGIIVAGCSLYMLLRCYIGGPAAAAVVSLALIAAGLFVLLKGRDIAKHRGRLS